GTSQCRARLAGGAADHGGVRRRRRGQDRLPAGRSLDARVAVGRRTGSGLPIPRQTGHRPRAAPQPVLRVVDAGSVSEPRHNSIALETQGGVAMSFIFRFDDPPREAELGGKARSLAALRGKDLSIPDGFVVLPHAFEASLPEAGRRALLEADERTDAILARIQPAPSVIRELSEALADLSPPGEPVAVRSSALEEDGCDYSFAGQLESFLF